MTERKREIKFKKGISPGELYGEISTPRPEFKEDLSRLVKPKLPPFVQFCKRVYSMAPALGKGAKFSEEYQSAINFLNWDLKPEEFNATIKFVMMFSLFAAVALIAILFAFPAFLLLPLMSFLGGLAYMYVIIIPILLVFLLVNYVQKYPLNAAKLEQKLALTYVPQIVGYLIMALKLVPNLEKAIEFAAEHGKGKIAEDFKRMLWDVQLGVYNTLSEGLDALAYRWGEYSSEFKHSLMMIRASVLEDTEEKRYAMLDKTMSNVLESVKGKMEDYARSLSQPSTVLFYIGVLLPLILIIILPIGSAFSGSALATPLTLFLIYNIGIPLIAFYFARKIIIERPPTYTPPVITDDYPGLPGKWKMIVGKTVLDIRIVILLVLIVGFAGSFYISAEGIPPKTLFNLGEDEPQFLPADKKLEEALEEAGYEKNYFEKDGKLFKELQIEYAGKSKEDIWNMVVLEQTIFTIEYDTTPYLFAFGLILTFSICFFIFLYYSTIYKKKIQNKIMNMETEFKDSLYVLASRLGENRPVEEAIDHTRKFLPRFSISERIFGRTVDNIKLMGLSLESAVFHPKYGSLMRIPSEIIVSGMKILVDSVHLGVNVAARTLISLSLQLDNAEKVNKKMKELVADISGMMTTMASFIAPMVLGITTALQKIVMVTLASIVGSGLSDKLAGIDTTTAAAGTDLFGGGMSSFGKDFLKAEAFQGMVSPLMFLIIVAIYVLELVIIMTYFTVKIEEDNDLKFRLALAKAIPIAMIVFMISVVASNMFVSGFK